jgi:transcriptional regulator with XRE-family HTH domain
MRERHAQMPTQEELADRAGLSARYLGSIERAAVSRKRDGPGTPGTRFIG